MRVLILGTDTDIGKTFISAALCQGWISNNQTITYHKPLQTGGEHLDAHFVRAHAPGVQLEYGVCLDAPMAPTHAARRQGYLLPKMEDLELPEAKHLLVEAAGGIFVPVDDTQKNWIDYAKHHRLPALVVSRNRLGTLNHTCLTMQALTHAGVDVRGVILSGEHDENTQTLRELLDCPLVEFPEVVGGSEHPQWDVKCRELYTRVQPLLANVEMKQDLQDLDQQYVWHPFTQHKTIEKPVVVEKAEGFFIELEDGRRLMDCQSSWWVHNLGHGRPEVREAMFQQQRDLDHVIFAGTTHKPAVECARRLLKHMPGLSKVFYSDNGSTAVEVGLKMAWQSHANLGQSQRRKIAKLAGGYHGDTFGAMSLGASGFHGPFEPLLFETLTLHPQLQHGGDETPPDDLKSWFQEHGEELAAVVIEPFMQGAGGMLLQDPKWLQELAMFCREYGVYLVADEVFTGMGRTGEFLACQRAGIQPDIVCLAKGLTGGSIPFAVTVATEEIFMNFYSSDPEKALLHGHTFAGNPIGCAITLRVLDLYEQQPFAQSALRLERMYRSWAQDYAEDLGVCNLRILGSILAVELPGSQDRGYFKKDAKTFHHMAMEHGLLLRPLGNTVYLVPPLLISESETQMMLDAWTQALKSWNNKR